MNKLTIKLRQHTPLIHFQHDQAGATLRATEVKPKLDRFILTQLGEGIYDKGVEKAKKNKWLIDETTALDYKLRFFISEEPLISEINNIKLYFGNLAKSMNDPEYKKLSFLNNPFKMDIFTLQSSFLKWFDENVNVSSFFDRNNFGSRQSKGFGSFYVDKSDEKYKNPVSTYSFTIDVVKQNNWSKLFDTIDLFYKSLRSGINLKGNKPFYFKSLLFLYFKSKDIQWDKKSIKERFFNSQLKQQITDHNNSDILTFSSPEQRLTKDLLGLSTNESWRSYSATVTKTNNNIDRFKSPITFKPLRIFDGQFKVYLCFESINPDFLNQSFEIKTRGKKLHLSTPAGFSVNDFFEWILNEDNFDINTHVDDSFHSHPQFKTLENIYQQLRNNFKIKENAR